MNADAKDGLFFLDTNVLVYSFDETAPMKKQSAQGLIASALRTRRGVISSQVVQEFLNVALRKFERPLTVSEAREFLATVLSPLCQHFPSGQFYDRALLLREEAGLGFYDSLIVTAAADSGCRVLLTEDLQHGRILRGLTIVNPFASK